MRFINEEKEQTVCGQNLNDVRFERIFDGAGPAELIFTSDGSATLSGFRVIYSGNDSIHHDNSRWKFSCKLFTHVFHSETMLQNQTIKVIRSNPCESNPCQNGGECSIATDDNFECSCGDFWTGSICESDIDECSGLVFWTV